MLNARINTNASTLQTQRNRHAAHACGTHPLLCVTQNIEVTPQVPGGTRKEEVRKRKEEAVASRKMAGPRNKEKCVGVQEETREQEGE